MIEQFLDKIDTSKSIKINGFDCAVIGFDINSERIIYSLSAIIKECKNNDMCYEESLEYFYFNIKDLCIKDFEPIICYDV